MSQRKIYVPTPDSNGTCYHAKVCNAHRLEPHPFDVAKVIIEREGLEPCSHCLEHHGLDSLLAGMGRDYRVKVTATREFDVHAKNKEIAEVMALMKVDIDTEEWSISAEDIWTK